MLAGGCGVIRSQTVINRAALQEQELIESKVRNYAAYEFALGSAYLKRARLAVGHSDHVGARQLARLASEAFKKAKAVAAEHKARLNFQPYRVDWDKPVGQK
ncbi:MAG: hypothetical protein CMH54_11935 [Myxococcales bacterium]|nr:hypothetical protein [Myxococcales bacterium]